MKRKRPSITLTFFAFVVSGCTTTLGRAADSWIGAPVDDFVVRAGVPRREMALHDGRVAYTWYLGCEITLVSRNGIVEEWSSTNCLSISPVPGKWQR